MTPPGCTRLVTRSIRRSSSWLFFGRTKSARSRISGPSRSRAGSRISIAMRSKRSCAGTTLRIGIFLSLGGLRKARPDSVNTGWRHPGFRGYADHMQTAEFCAGVEALLAFASDSRTTVMCAEALWWQCHRQLLADALLARGVPVCHILGTGDAKLHHLSDFARLENGRVTYPGLL